MESSKPTGGCWGGGGGFWNAGGTREVSIIKYVKQSEVCVPFTAWACQRFKSCFDVIEIKSLKWWIIKLKHQQDSLQISIQLLCGFSHCHSSLQSSCSAKKTSTVNFMLWCSNIVKKHEYCRNDWLCWFVIAELHDSAVSSSCCYNYPQTCLSRDSNSLISHSFFGG